MKKQELQIKKSIKTTICIVVLVLFNLVWGFIFLQSKRPENYVNPYPLIDPARSFIDQDNFFTTIEPLRKELVLMVESYEKEGYEIGLYFEFLNTGASVSINEEKRFFPASLSKMPTAFVVMKKVQDGEWKLSNELVLFLEDRNSDFGDLYKKPAGTKITIENLLFELLVNSDDTAHAIFLRNLSEDGYADLFTALGLNEFYDDEYKVTAKEYTRIFRALYTSSYLSREYSSLLLDILSSTPFNSFLDSGIPDTVKFAHKIGIDEVGKTYLDSGIAYVPNRPYLVTLMVNVPDEKTRENSEQIMRDISEKIYMYVSSY